MNSWNFFIGYGLRSWRSRVWTPVPQGNFFTKSVFKTTFKQLNNSGERCKTHWTPVLHENDFFYSHTSFSQTHTSLPLDGVARNYLFYLHGYARSCHLWSLDPFFPTSYALGEKKTIWSELESNPGPLAPQATALTTRPCLLGLYMQMMYSALSR